MNKSFYWSWVVVLSFCINAVPQGVQVHNSPGIPGRIQIQPNQSNIADPGSTGSIGNMMTENPTGGYIRYVSNCATRNAVLLDVLNHLTNAASVKTETDSEKENNLTENAIYEQRMNLILALAASR